MKVFRCFLFIFLLLGAFLLLGNGTVTAHNEDDSIHYSDYLNYLGINPINLGQLTDPRIYRYDNISGNPADTHAIIFHEHFVARNPQGQPQNEFDGTVLFTLWGGPGYDPVTGTGGLIDFPPDIVYETIEGNPSPDLKVLFEPSRIVAVGSSGVDADDKGIFQSGDWVYAYMIINDSGLSPGDDPPNPPYLAEINSSFPLLIDIRKFRFDEGPDQQGLPLPGFAGTTISALGDVEDTGVNPFPTAGYSTNFNSGGWDVSFVDGPGHYELMDYRNAIPLGIPYNSNLIYMTTPFGPEVAQNSQQGTEGRSGVELIPIPSSWPTIECDHFVESGTSNNEIHLKPGESVTVELMISNKRGSSPYDRMLPAPGSVNLDINNSSGVNVGHTFPDSFYLDNPQLPFDAYAAGPSSYIQTFTISLDSNINHTPVIFNTLVSIDDPYMNLPPFNDPGGAPYFFDTFVENPDCVFTIIVDFEPEVDIIKEVKPRGAPDSEYQNVSINRPLCGEVTFRITVTNSGLIDIGSLHVWDTMEPCLNTTAPLDWNFSYNSSDWFIPGETEVIVFDADVDPNANLDLCKNEAFVDGVSSDGVPTPPPAKHDDAYVNVLDVDVDLDIDVSATEVATCDEVTFILNITNTGSWDLDPVYLTNVTHPGLDCGTYPGPSVNIGPIVVGQTKQISITCEVPPGASGTMGLSATVSARPEGVNIPDCDVNSSNSADFTVLVPAIRVTCQSVDPDPASVCEDVAYTFLIENIGQVRLNPVTLGTPVLSPGLTLKQVSPPGPFDMNVGDTQLVTVLVNIDPSASASPKSVTLSAVGHPFDITIPDCDVSDEDICTLTTVLIPNIAIQKTVSLDGVNFFELVEVQHGDTVTFKVVITNTSPNLDLDTVDLYECINDPGLEGCVDITGPKGFLAAGDSITETYTCTIASNAPVGEEICDICTVVGHPAGVDAGNHDCDVEDSDPACVIIAAEGVPTLSEWGLILLAGSLMLLLVLRNRKGVFFLMS